MGQPKAPTPPSAGQSYKSGIKAYLRYLPTLLSGEQDARAQYDPQRIEEQLGLQSRYGSTQYQQQLDALKQLDPEGTALRSQLGHQVTDDLSLGTSLSPDMQRQVESYVRAGQAARGNDLGDSAAFTEALGKGQLGMQLYQQRIQNAGNFLSSPTPEQQLLTVNPVSPDRSSAYVNPNAGYAGQQFGLQNYQNVLSQYALSGGGRNPWAGAATGAATGALQGGATGGYYGAAAGAIIGGVGGYFSDVKCKTNITIVGESPSHIPIVEFEYAPDMEIPGRFRGVLAQHVEKLFPEVVSEHHSGFKVVNYGAIDVPFERIS